MFHRGGGQQRSPRYTVITHVAVLFAMALSVVKGALRHVCTPRPVFLSLAPQAPCHSGGRPALSVPTSIPPSSTPSLTTHHHEGRHALVPCPKMPTVHSDAALQRETKMNWKETKWPHAAFPVKSFDRPREGGPQRRVQLKMMTTEITSQVVVLEHGYTLALVCPFGYSVASRS